MSKFIKITLAIIIVLGLLIAFKYFRQPPIQLADTPQHTLHLNSGTAFPKPRDLPSFKLTDFNHQLFGNKQLQDQWSFLFFGYTQCPGICPATLGKLNELAALLNPASNLAQFIFVSIDPNDTPSALKSYFAQPNFEKAQFLGVTGTLEEIRSLAQIIGLYVSENNIPVNGHIEHSGTVLLVNPDGQLAAVFSNPNNPSAISRDFKALVHEYHQSLS